MNMPPPPPPPQITLKQTKNGKVSLSKIDKMQTNQFRGHDQQSLQKILQIQMEPLVLGTVD